MTGRPYPPRDERKEIVFVRHAQSVANREGFWNGRTDGPLSDEGVASLDALGRRLSTWEFDGVISSPLVRTVKTAESFADDIEIDESFVELNMGRWEGMSFVDVQEKHGDQLREAVETRTLPMGETGESLEQLRHRALDAVDGLFESMAAGQRVAVVTHGGFLQAVLGRHLAGEGRRVHALTSNTGITRLIEQFGRVRLASFNDTGHFGAMPASARQHLEAAEPVYALIRHGRTQANAEQRWQGQGDWDLDEVGVAQADALGAWYGRHSTVYTSPLRRAASTAQRVAMDGVVEIEGLKEINMGLWEGMTTPEILEKWPDHMEEIYQRNVDLPRGQTGETWGQLTRRMSDALGNLETSEDTPTVVVGHGGAIRAYVSSLTKTDDTHAQSLYTPGNTSVTHVAMTSRGPEILDYAVAAHLEGVE